METFLTPMQEDLPEKTPVVEIVQYLEKDNWLSEYTTEEEKDLVRRNIKAAYSDNTYTKQETVDEITSRISQALEKYADFDPEKCVTDEEFNDKLSEFIRIDGTTPFAKVQNGVTPNNNSSNTALTTVEYVKNLLKGYLTSGKQQEILTEVTNILKNYALKNSVYTKEESSKEITSKLNGYASVSKNNRFTAPQSGLYTPTIGNHLTTKNYVDNLMYTHTQDFDPHGYTTILANKLKNYVLKSNVLDKTQTYTRAQIDSIIDRLVKTAVNSALENYMSLSDPHNILKQVKELGYITNNGSTPFTAPQKGVNAIAKDDLVTLAQLDENVEHLLDQILSNQPIWKTSGPIESTVGHLDDGTPVPETMTLQEVLDAIFYGKGISISAPEYVTVNNKVPITLCIHGSTGLVEYAELYQDGNLLFTFGGIDFESGCISVESSNISKDTEFTFIVNYTNGATHKESISVKMSLPTFVGLLPKWKFGNTVTWEYLIELSLEEPDNNKFIDTSNNLNQISINYNFKDAALRQPFIVVPATYPDLNNMSTNSQKFELEAFNVIDMIPLQVPGVERDIVFKIYIYKQALSSLNQEVTFNFA